jgi:very-short-patch-repair endonuclease
LIIECDGHEFHDRTKEQASNDRARDRKLKKLGYEVFRYTGSDIYSDPFKCAMDAWDMVVRSVQSLKRDFDNQYPVTMDDLLD